MAYLGILGAIPMVMLMFYIVNSASAIQDKTRNQDAADMIALVHAAEAARSLNTVGMNQVTMTQVFAAGVTSGSLMPIIILQIGLAAQATVAVTAANFKMCKKYKILIIPKLVAAAKAACMVPSALFAARMGALSARLATIIPEYSVFDAVQTMTKSVDALNAINDEIYSRFPEAVSVQAQQIAKDFNVTNIYFDDSCANGSGDEPRRAGSCKSNSGGDQRQGMNLPIIKASDLPISNTKRLAAHLRFCAGLKRGTVGGSIGPGISVTAMNGSYTLRGFDALEGPLDFGGPDNNNHLTDHINDLTKIGEMLEDYDFEINGPFVYDGLMFGANVPFVAIDSAYTASKVGQAAVDGITALAPPPSADDAREQLEAAGDTGGVTTDQIDAALEGFEQVAAISPIGAKKPKNSGAIPMPGRSRQTEEENSYKDLVTARVANMCAGDPLGGALDAFGLQGVADSLPSVVNFALGALPAINVWFPADEGMIPTILPDIEDFSDHYKVVAFSNRKPNNRWSENVFGNPVQQFFTYSQGIVFNADEINLFSQNWEAMLMPATKLEDSGADIAQRMRAAKPTGYEPLADRLDAVVGEGTWADVVTR